MESSAFELATPESSPSLRRRRERDATEPPLLIFKRKRTSSVDYSPSEAYPLSTYTSLPFLDCTGSWSSNNHASNDSEFPPLPKITLLPRRKKPRKYSFVPLTDEIVYQEQCSTTVVRRRRLSSTSSRQEAHDICVKDLDIASTTTTTKKPTRGILQRASSSRSIGSTVQTTRRPSLTMPRSLSLQFNLSILNLAASATTTGIPKRNSSRSMSCTEDNTEDSNNRRSPVAATLDYIAASMRFPDVAIGLSI